MNNGNSVENQGSQYEEFSVQREQIISVYYLKIAMKKLQSCLVGQRDDFEKERIVLPLKIQLAITREVILLNFVAIMMVLFFIGKFEDQAINKVFALIVLLLMPTFYLWLMPRYYWTKKKLSRLERNLDYCTF